MVVGDASVLIAPARPVKTRAWSCRDLSGARNTLHMPEEASANAHDKAKPKGVEEFKHFVKERFGCE